MTLTLTSDDPRFDEIYLSNFATINVLDILRRIPGVGRVFQYRKPLLWYVYLGDARPDG